MKSVGRFCSLLVTISLVLGMVMSPAVAAQSPEHPFTDIKGSSYETAISALWDLGIVSGMEPDKYEPEGPVTRAQMAALIVRSLGKAQEAEMLMEVASEYSDVPSNHWARGVIALASRMSIVKGDAGRFSPSDQVNYAQAATMLVRALGYESQVTGGYPTGYVVKANEIGLLKDVKFVLNSPVNRAEAARLLFNAIYNVSTADSGLTWSQSIHKRPASLAFATLPEYVAPAQKITLNATATDLVGKPIAGVQVNYRVLNGAGTIQGNSLTVGDGMVKIEASTGSLVALATLTSVSGLTIAPTTFAANKGGTVTFTATAVSGGLRVPVQPEWKVVQGPAAIDQSGQLTVSDYGMVTVQASLGTLTASATGQANGRVAITQKPDYVVPGLTYTLSASVTEVSGKPISVAVTWSATGAIIDPATGRLSNASGDQVTIKATAAGVSEQITIPVIKSIQVTPANVSVLNGKTVTFTAKGIDSTGKEWAIAPAWDRTTSAVGIINGEGIFAGTGSGASTITATLGSLTGRAQVQVSGAPARLSVTPASNSVPIGGSTTLAIKLMDLAGIVSAVDDQPVSLTLNDNNRGSLSRTLALTQKGEVTVTFTPSNTAGTASISVSVPGTAISAQTVVVSSYQPTPSYIQLSATPTPLATGGGVATIMATLHDASGFAVPASQPLYVTVNASGGNVGGIAGSTITIPAGQTSGSVSFISNGTVGMTSIHGTSTYTVRPVLIQTTAAGPAAAVKIRPIKDAVPVTGLSSLQVQVEVVDSKGVLLAGNSSTEVELAVSALANWPGATYMATANSGVATFSVPAYVIGTVTLTARLKGGAGATDTATAQFVPGVFSSIRMTAQPPTLVADGITQGQVIAEVVDRNGTVLTSVNPTITFRKLGDTGATSPLSSPTVTAVNGKAVLSIQSTRLAGTDTWYAVAPGMETLNLATVSTSASSGQAHTLRVTGGTNLAVGTASALVVQVVDQAGQVVLSDSGRTIAIGHSIPGLSISPTTATTQNGSATFTVVGTQATSGAITFTTVGLPVPSVSATLTFTGTGSTSTAYNLSVTAPSTARVGNVFNVTVKVTDTLGQQVTTDHGRTITATAIGVGVINSPLTTTSGQAAFAVVPTSTGTLILTFTATGLPQPSQTVVVTITN